MKYLAAFMLLVLSSSSIICQNIPIDFEVDGNGAQWNWTTFENATNPELEIVSNPEPDAVNSSSTVAKFTALQSGAPFAGCESMHGAGIGSFTIDASTSIINISVWKSVISDVGIKLVRFDDWSLGEIKIANTLVNQWEQISFDFSDHIDLPYDQIVIFPDFDARTSDNIIYFDDIFGETVVGLEEMDLSSISIGPNPVLNEINIQTPIQLDEMQLYDVTGKLIWSESNLQSPYQIDSTWLNPGIYLLSITADDRKVTRRIMKH